MTEEFIRKRIDEQIVYIAEVMLSDSTSQRKNEILVSACGQLEYFRSKLRGYRMKIHALRTIGVIGGGVSSSITQSLLVNMLTEEKDIGAVVFVDTQEDIKTLKRQLYDEPITYTTGTLTNSYLQLTPIPHQDFTEKAKKDNFTNNPIGAIGNKNKRKRDYGRGNGRK